ncbi:(2Fe-2S)-binding protein [Nocardia sp. X0981]
MAAQSPDLVNTARGPLLADEAWLAARIAELNASWRTDSPRVGATLWWCTAASSLVEQVVRALAREESIAAPTLDRLDLSVRADGTVEKIRIADADTGSGDIPTALRETLATVIGRLAAVSGVREPALWAVVTDAVAGWALDVGTPQIGQRLTAALGDALPAPRFVEVAGRTFVRRASCCLIYEAPGCEKCVSCPKRRPAEREALLAGWAQRG